MLFRVAQIVTVALTNCYREGDIKISARTHSSHGVDALAKIRAQLRC